MTQAQPLIQTLPMTLGAPMSDDPSNPATIEIPLQIELPNGQTLFAAVALAVVHRRLYVNIKAADQWIKDQLHNQRRQA